MALPSSGIIRLSQVNTELGKASNTATSLNAADVRALAGKASGSIKMSDLHGKTAAAGQAMEEQHLQVLIS